MGVRLLSRSEADAGNGMKEVRLAYIWYVCVLDTQELARWLLFGSTDILQTLLVIQDLCWAALCGEPISLSGGLLSQD